MYKLKKRLVISAAHQLKLDYPSKCSALHGHNWIIDVYLRAHELDQNGMIMDFSVIKEKVEKVLDHQVLNNILEVNPTAENIAKWVCDRLAPQCYKVVVEESPNNIASYEVDDE